MSTSYPQAPPSPPPEATISVSSSTVPNNIINIPQQPPYLDSSSQSSPSSPSSSSVTIVIVVIAVAIIVATVIYLLLRSISKRFSRTYPATTDRVILRRNTSTTAPNNANSRNLLDPVSTLPLFTFRSVAGNHAGGDCAVCLSKFEPEDRLRLLPLCCHAFHAGCIDTWLVTNQTCPLCRSTVKPSDSDILDKIHSASVKNQSSNNNTNGSNENSNRNGNENGGSFRVEIGSVSRRRDPTESGRLTYSLGSFEYVVDDGYEVSVESTLHGPVTYKEPPAGEEPVGEVFAREASVGRNWMVDYIDRLASFSLSSRTMSYRNSGRFFSGSSRRSDSVFTVEDLEANRIGEEISESFQWLSL